jgi:serine/threonine-protein kinase RsbW
MKQISQSFPGRYVQLRNICDFIKPFVEESGFSENETYEILMAVDEACSNIIEHAYGAEGIGDIDCSCSFEPPILTVLLRDNGKSFSPRDIPKPNIKASLKNRKNHGLGFFIMQKIMDEVQYSPNMGNGNQLILRKTLEK